MYAVSDWRIVEIPAPNGTPANMGTRNGTFGLAVLGTSIILRAIGDIIRIRAHQANQNRLMGSISAPNIALYRRLKESPIVSFVTRFFFSKKKVYFASSDSSFENQEE